MIRRTPAKIHFPMRSLKLSALWRIVKQLSKADDVEHLEIPKSLRHDLSNLYEKYHRYQAQLTRPNPDEPAS